MARKYKITPKLTEEEIKQHIETPVETKPYVPEPITLHFTVPIEVYINGKGYLGTEVTVENYSVASEVVRLAKNAFGNDILK